MYVSEKLNKKASVQHAFFSFAAFLLPQLIFIYRGYRQYANGALFIQVHGLLKGSAR